MRPHPGQKGHPTELREQAAVMRRGGESRATIARQLDVGASTVARWLREDGVPAPRADPSGPYDAQLGAVRERWAFQEREQDLHRHAVGDVTDRELLLVGAAIYWAEGAKSKPWRRSHYVTFMNSDSSMVEVFFGYLALTGVPRSRITCRLQIHPTADVPAAEAFWREVVGDGVVWMRTTLKKPNSRPARHNLGDAYRGCLAITVRQSAGDYRRLAGTWEGVATAVRGQRSPVV